MDAQPALPPALVQQFVAVAHGDIEAVEGLLEQQPTLLNAAWDWGGGDWETALGAAAHMGRRDIAELLLAHGARLDLFAAAMLGYVEVVAAALAVDPAQREVSGPHGISLLAHAQAGGAAAAAVVALLQEPPAATSAAGTGGLENRP
jgi:hypothetical protein